MHVPHAQPAVSLSIIDLIQLFPLYLIILSLERPRGGLRLDLSVARGPATAGNPCRLKSPSEAIYQNAAHIEIMIKRHIGHLPRPPSFVSLALMP